MAKDLEHESIGQPIVLIVDDDPAVRALLGRAVESVECRPVLAASGAEGYDCLARLGDSVALLLLDLGMPGMDGFAFRERQLDATPVARIPTIILSGRRLARDEIARLRPAAVLTKPVPMATLQATITLHARPLDVLSDVALSPDWCRRTQSILQHGEYVLSREL